MIELYDFQAAGVADIRQAFRQHDNVLYVLPTGGGKTVCFSYIAAHAADKGNATLIMVHRQELVRQIVRSLRDFGINPGVICAGFPAQPLATVQVASVQTLVRRLDRVARPGLIITDECHHAVSTTYRAILKHFAGVKHLGVTATPWRMNGKGLGAIFQTMVLGPTAAELIAIGKLAKPRYFVPPSHIDLAGVRTTAGDYNRQDVEQRTDRPTITGDAVGHYKKICPDAKAVAFCTSIKHAEHVADSFNAHGIAAASIDGTMDNRTRAGILDDLATGKIAVLTSVDLIGEGFDLPAIEAAILLRPTKSLVVHLQAIGRALRPAPGKTHAVIMDHVGNLNRDGLGFVEDEREWTLEGRDKKAKPKKPLEFKRCPACFVLYAPSRSTCPECGTQAVVAERQIEQVDGELHEIDEAGRLAMARTRKMEQGSANSLEALIELGRRRQYKNPRFWAMKVMENRHRKHAPAWTV